MEIKSVFIIGAGLMGSGIAQVSAQAGYKTKLFDVNPQALEAAMGNIKNSYNKFVAKGKLTQEQIDKALANLSVTSQMDDASEFDLIIEAVFESVELKQKIFKQLETICKHDAIFATNTSAIAITKIASITKKPDKVVGLHFFSPVPLMKLVEIVSGVKTSQETIDLVAKVASDFGKTSVLVKKDFGGFIVNRVYLPYIRMALLTLTEGVADVEEIDIGVKLGLGYPMGPFELGDMVGWDIMYNAMNAIYKDTEDNAFAPPLLLKRLVDAGVLGKKTGEGFYLYDDKGQKIGVNNDLAII
ncbi:MAG: 3-hydroxyacyl-CoA dehydrogenase family protein [Syntrophomonadaceae bacterium]|jgi:3-hydroxybutyryl-CoA dehydrogenase|nr:3-hydroxyacyl-CoA dehydrogenase family protein [Syntrophomonadaceae bacterium]